MKKHARFILALVPIAYFVFAATLAEMRRPYYSAGILDPEYIYLMSSLNVAELRTSRHSDHPGTPIQTVGGLALRGFQLADGIKEGFQPIRDLVFTHPEQAIKVMSLTVIALTAVMIGLLGYWSMQFGAPAALAVLIQLSLFTYKETLFFTGRLMPEGFMLIPVIFLAAMLLKKILKPDSLTFRDDVKHGLAVGLGVATKLVFLPLAATLLFRPGRNWRERFSGTAVGLTAAVAGFYLFTIPIWRRIDRMYDWIGRLFANPEGKASLSVGAILEQAIRLAQQDPFVVQMIVILCALVITLLFTRKSGATLAATLLISTIGILIAVTKRPNHSYLIGPMAILCPCILAVLFTMRRKLGTVLILAFGLWIVSQTYTATRRNLHAHAVAAETQSQVGALVATLSAEYPQCQWIGCYPSSLREYALALGNAYVDGFYTKDLGRLYPEALSCGGDGELSFGNFPSEANPPFGTAEMNRRLAGGKCYIILQRKAFVERSSLVTQFLGEAGGEAAYRILKVRPNPGE